MNLLNKIGFNKKKIVVIIQCRLSSTRLPRKALLNLGGRCVVDWTLQTMKKVKADKYYLATDNDSAVELTPFANKWGYDIFAGSRDDVLDRFCKVIELSKADIVIRATADNPFLFYDAVNDLREEYLKRIEDQPIDYMTFEGLPHGSGVEIFDAHSLLRARDLTDDPYDHEHVGPSLYNHKDRFVSMFIKAPDLYNHPEFRTTIDTPWDYRRAQAIVRVLSGVNTDINPVQECYSTENILFACQDSSVHDPFLLIPSVQKGHGTGHLRRCLEIACGTGCDIYLSSDDMLEQCQNLVDQYKSEGLKSYQLVDSLDNLKNYSLVVLDSFITNKELLDKITQNCAVLSIDEGCKYTDDIDYLLDIIPSIGLNRKANLVDPGFIPLPKKIRSDNCATTVIRNVLVTVGGEDPAGLSIPAAKSLVKCSLDVTLVAPSENICKEWSSMFTDTELKNVIIQSPVNNLREELYKYDLVVTHYGFTAFEARGAGCAVILLGTTPLHSQLAKKYNFACLNPNEISSDNFSKLINKSETLFQKSISTENKSLNSYLLQLSQGKKLVCPVCQTQHNQQDFLVSRTEARTFRRCKSCGMLYISWTVQSRQTEYNRNYFYEDYEKQYGKTYEDDFVSIKVQGIRRVSNIDMLVHHHKMHLTKTVLDIGCALGPFLDAANDAGWKVYGTDISQDAVDYVHQKFNYPAVQSAFPEIDCKEMFGIEQFDAVTMWYVIEHFQNLDAVLSKVSAIVKKNGIFAFSTPSASGVSAKYNTQSFFENSPSDHYTLWEIKQSGSILKKYGFKIERIVSTGIHPERFPIVKKYGWKPNSFGYKCLEYLSRRFKLGDTFEIYCKKIR